MDCKYCKDLESARTTWLPCGYAYLFRLRGKKYPDYTHGIGVQYEGWYIPTKYCPECGRKL